MDAKMYVGNLSYDVTQEELQALFEAHGAVSDVFIVKDRESGRPRGFAFVTMEEKSAMDAAIEALNGEEFMGRNLAINEARPREDRPRGGGGGGFSGGLAGGGAGGSGVVILRYPSDFTITVGGGLTSSTATSGTSKITTFTAGTDNVSFAL